MSRVPSLEINPRAIPCWDRSTLIAVIRTYQAGQRTGLPQLEVEIQTMAAFQEIHSDLPRSEVGRIVPHIIAWAARERGKWFWKGCERPYVDPRREPVWESCDGALHARAKPAGARQ